MTSCKEYYFPDSKTAPNDCEVHIFDISDKNSTKFISSLSTQDPFETVTIAIHGNYCYVGNLSHLDIWDLKDPFAPSFVSRLSGRIYSLDINEEKRIAYILSQRGLEAFSLSDPSNPTPLGPSLTEIGSGHIVETGDNVYIAGAGALKVVNTADPSDLSVTDTIPIPGTASGIAAVGDFAFVTIEESGLHVVHLKTPTHPNINIISTFETPEAKDIFVRDNNAYIADTIEGLLKIDISEPTRPQLTGRVDTVGEAYSVSVTDTTAYVAWGESGFYTIDIGSSKPAVSFPVVDTLGNAQQVAAGNGFACVVVGSSLQIVEIDQNFNPQLVGTLPLSDTDIIQDVTVEGDYAYLVGNFGLHIVDVSIRREPVLKRTVNTGSGGNSVKVAGGYAYVGGDVLSVVDVFDPPNASFIASESIPNTPSVHELAVVENTTSAEDPTWVRRVYAVDLYRLYIVDVDKPYAPQYMDSFKRGPGAWQRGVYSSEDELYLTVWIEHTYPNAQYILEGPKSTLSMNHPLEVMTVDDGVAYVIQNGELQAWDLTQPGGPVLIGVVNPLVYNTDITDLAVSNGIAYITLGSKGLVCLPVPKELVRSNPLQDSSKQINVTIPAVSLPGDYNINVIDSLDSDELRGAITISDKVANARAIIVAGMGPGPDNNPNDLWDNIKLNANWAYKTLRYQGYSKENIRYLSAEEAYLDGNSESVRYGDADKTTLVDSISNWAVDGEDVLIYLIGHGEKGYFTLKHDNNSYQILEAEQFADLLNNLQEEGNMEGRVLVIYEACNSGSFLQPLRTPEGKSFKRIIATSSTDIQPSLLGTEGRISFSYSFWTVVNEVGLFTTAFNSANQALKARDNNLPLAYRQEPWLDANADGIATTWEPVSDADNEIGRAYISALNIPVLTEWSPNQSLEGTSSSTLWARGTSNVVHNTWDKVWAVIFPPDYNPSDRNTIEKRIVTVDLDLDETNQRYQAEYNGFTLNGRYTVNFYASNQKEHISLPQSSSIIQTEGIQQCDVNRDGNVNLADEILVLQVASNLNPSDTINPQYDANLNGQLDIADAVYILNKVAEE